MGVSKRNVGYVIMYLTVGILVDTACATSQQKQFKQIVAADSCLDNYNYDLFDGENVTQIACVNHCVRHSGCRGVRFEPSTGYCSGGGMLSDVPPPPVSSTGSVYYIDSAYLEKVVGGARLNTDRGFSNKGRVEVCYNGKWGTICDDGWIDHLTGHQHNNKLVMCRTLGYSMGNLLPPDYYRSSLSMAKLHIWFDAIRCGGNELTIFDCPRRSAGTHDCIRSEDVMLSCY